MNGKINVLGIEIDNYTAKETMKKSIEYLTTEPVNMIEVATVDVLMDTNTELMLKEQMKDFDLVLAGDRTVLEAAEVSERKRLQETDDRLYLQMFFRYLHKNTNGSISLWSQRKKDGGSMNIWNTDMVVFRCVEWRRFPRRIAQTICWSMRSMVQKLIVYSRCSLRRFGKISR